MINKIKQFIKEEWKFLIFIALLYLGLTYELPYVIYTPGGSINMSERVEGDNTYDADGSLSMTYVSLVRGTPPMMLLSFIVPDWDIYSSEGVLYDNTDMDETIEIDKIYMKEAISNAEYVAYNAAGVAYEELNIHNLVTYVDKNAKTVLKYGDEILSIDGFEYTTLKELQNYISTKNIGDKVRIEYIRNKKTKVDDVELIDIDGTAKVGVSIATVSDFNTDYNIKIKTKSSESGPSGGLITALEIYNKITENDITHGKTVMGTGTIDKDGSVGIIGGVKYKLLGAYDEGAEIFICPKENYEEAIKVKEEKDMDITILGVSTFDETINSLANIK